MASNATLAWSNIVAALGAAIVSTLVTAWYFRGLATPATPPSGIAASLAGVGKLVTETITYIPHILLLFGVLADMFTMEGVYSIPSLIALIAIPLNYFMKYFWDGLGSIWVSILKLYNTKPGSFSVANPLLTKSNRRTATNVPAPARPAANVPAPAAPAANIPPPAAPAANIPPPAAPAANIPPPAAPAANVPPPAPAPAAPKPLPRARTGVKNPLANIPTYKASLFPPGAGTGLVRKQGLGQYQTLKTRPASFLQRGGSIKEYDGCDVQGFSMFHNPYAPQSLVITATVFMYYIFDLIMNRGWVDATAPIVVFIVLYTAETFIIGKCDESEGFSAGVQGLISFIHGLIFGGTAYGVVSSRYPKSLPSRVLPDFPRKTAADLTRRADGTYVDENNNPWVILPNGNAIPSMSAGSAETATIDETSTSTGAAATPGSCPGGNC